MEIIIRSYLGNWIEVLIRFGGFLFSLVVELLIGDLIEVSVFEFLWRRVYIIVRGFL